MSSCSPCVPVGGAGCALLGGLELRLNLTVVGIGVDRMGILHPIEGGAGSRGYASLDPICLDALLESPWLP